jgi:hypothetical protein
LENIVNDSSTSSNVSSESTSQSYLIVPIIIYLIPVIIVTILFAFELATIPRPLYSILQDTFFRVSEATFDSIPSEIVNPESELAFDTIPEETILAVLNDAIIDILMESLNSIPEEEFDSILADAVNSITVESTELGLTSQIYFFLIWLGMVWLPLLLTIGVFVVYRNTYRHRFTDPTSSAIDRDNEWQTVISKALEWKRFALPLSFFSLFVTVIPIFLLSNDISAFELASGEGRFIGAAYLPLLDVDISTTVFYFGYLGFIIYFLETTRRRYVSRNLVPHFYMTSAFRFLYVTIIIPVFVVFFTNSVTPLIEGQPTGLDNPYLLIASFVVGMFPLQLLAPIIESVRKRLGMASYDQLSITIIQGIDNTIESLLQEENIDSVQVLAMTNKQEIHQRTAIPEKVIAEWQNQAKLYHVLGTEELIRRFARIGINDFDDLKILAKNGQIHATASSRFIESFKQSMTIHDDHEAINQSAFWDVLIQVLIREYEGVYGSTEKPAFIEEPVEFTEIVQAEPLEPADIVQIEPIESADIVQVEPIESSDTAQVEPVESAEIEPVEPTTTSAG